MTTIPISAVRQESLSPSDENCLFMTEEDRATDRIEIPNLRLTHLQLRDGAAYLLLFQTEILENEL